MSMSPVIPVASSSGAGPGHLTRSMGAGPARDDPSDTRRREKIRAGRRPDRTGRPHHDPGQGARLRLECVAPEGDR